jgi:hypothetical protein
MGVKVVVADDVVVVGFVRHGDAADEAGFDEPIEVAIDGGKADFGISFADTKADRFSSGVVIAI